MDSKLDYKYFLLVGPKKISLKVLNSKNEFLYTKERSENSLTLEENLDSLENFLKQNIFEVEKNLNNHIKDVILILDHDDFVSVDMSFKINFKETQLSKDNMTNSLIDVKNQFKKTVFDYEIIHIMINKYIIDGLDHLSLPMHNNYQNLSLEIKFICLKNDIIQKLRKILSKYQISLNKILCYSYLSKLNSYEDENIFIIADKVINGFNQNEIFLVNKDIKNSGFFEKFFNIFN